MKKNALNFTLLFLLCISLFSCYERNEACLDFFASNYDLSADDACADCCTFPKLIMQFSHRYDSTFFSVNDTLIDDFDNPFVFRQFAFFISEIVLIDMQGKSHFIEDSILLNSGGVDKYYKNDYQLVMAVQSSYTIGSIKIEEPISKVIFKIGVDIADLDLSMVDDDFAILPFVDTLAINGQFIPWRYQVERDTTSGIITEVNAELSDIMTIEIDKELNNVVGQDIRVPITIEYRKLLEGIDMTSSSDLEMRTLINNNFSKTFN